VHVLDTLARDYQANPRQCSGSSFACRKGSVLLTDSIHGGYEVAVDKRTVYVRAKGLASMTNCLCVRDFIEDMLDEGRRIIVMDLAECTGMDSTFMGVLAGAASYPRDTGTAKVGLAVINANASLIKLLTSVGLNELVLINPKHTETPNVAYYHLGAQGSEEERIALVRDAHQHLLKTSKQNEDLFGDLVEVLEAEMRKRGLL